MTGAVSPILTGQTKRTTPVIRALTGVVAAAAIIIPAVIVRNAPHIVPARAKVTIAQRVVPRTEVPKVDPLAFQSVAPADARSINAGIPFSTLPVPAARPLVLREDPVSRARALDCLAAAVLYEAGDDTVGERAVAQVVLNRLRHPAFPKSVCGVVFEGSERRTGCQFTFTCDGALVRHRWSDAAWARARAVADAALNGAVYTSVGYATHYHTDWVVPYWSASLDKIAAVGTHLFFRWTGWWGTPAAFSHTIGASEPAIAQLGWLSTAHRSDATYADVATPQQRMAMLVDAITKLPAANAGDQNSFLVTIDGPLPPEDFPQLAAQSCGTRDYCKFMAWTDYRMTPKSLPLEPYQVGSMAFSYFRDRAHGFNKALWNCSRFPRPDAAQCMKVQVLAPAPAPVVRGNEGVAPVPALAQPGAATAERPTPRLLEPKPSGNEATPIP